MTVTVAQESIGPADAVKILAKNPNNRSIRPTVIESFRRDIAAGRWVLNGESIKLTEDGTLIDGQHRLQAVIEAGKPIETVVVRGVPSGAQDTIDRGARRTFGDTLHLRGEKHSAVLAGGTRASWFISNYGIPNPPSISPSSSELLTYLGKNPGLREATVLAVQGSHSTMRLVPSTSVALYYAMQNIDKAKADEFWRQFLENDAPKGTPIDVLRDALLRDLGRDKRVPPMARMAMIIKAWNFWLSGKNVSMVVFHPSTEAFPHLNAPIKD